MTTTGQITGEKRERTVKERMVINVTFSKNGIKGTACGEDKKYRHSQNWSDADFYPCDSDKKDMPPACSSAMICLQERHTDKLRVHIYHTQWHIPAETKSNTTTQCSHAQRKEE